LYLDLSLNMKGLISQRLIPTKEGGRAAAIEILTGSPRVKDLIKDGKIHEIKEAMEGSEQYGMQTFDMALLALFKADRITEEEAMKNADSPNNLRLKLKQGEGFSAKAEFSLMTEKSAEDEDEEEEVEEDPGQMF